MPEKEKRRKNIMKKARFLNSVGKKYIVGYVIVAVFSVVLLMVAVICNNYVSVSMTMLSVK